MYHVTTMECYPELSNFTYIYLGDFHHFCFFKSPTYECISTYATSIIFQFFVKINSINFCNDILQK